MNRPFRRCSQQRRLSKPSYRGSSDGSMGCTTSKAAQTNAPPLRIRTESEERNAPLTSEEISERIDSPETIRTFQVNDTLSISYAWVSQRGYYPDAIDKENQDTYSVNPSLNGDPNVHFFAVYDGHGRDGDKCSRYTRDNLPHVIHQRLKLKDPNLLNSKEIKRILTVAHLEVNQALHNHKPIDDVLSGTTAISILMCNDTMYVSNVGDSRAIIVSEEKCDLNKNETKYVAKPLSTDQTPYRKDERERLKRYGARILSMDQIEGLKPHDENWGDIDCDDIDEGGDPPRVWSTKGNWPGTAFSRSIGDKAAKDLGVTAEPEILERVIDHEKDKYIIIASDGVFEFLTNQMVADIVKAHDNILVACKEIASASYDLWLQYEVRTDDITVIILKIQGKNDENMVDSQHTDTTTSDTHNVTIEQQVESRPVRRVMSREKKKNIIMQTTSDVDNEDVFISGIAPENSIVKSEEDRNSIIIAIKNNFLFQHLNSVQRDAIISVMEPINVEKGTWVIKQGDKGDKFYVIDSGSFEVRVLGLGKTDSNGGDVVHVYHSGPEQHPGFGELSLMYDKPRAASVIAITDGKLWALDRVTFKAVVIRSMNTRKGIIRTLRKVKILECLNFQQMQRLADILVEETFDEGVNIITQGEQGDTFYVIAQGKCDVLINKNDGAGDKCVVTLKELDYFGERALLTSDPRAATVLTKSQVKVFSIGKSAFEEVLGSLAKIIDQDRLKREKLAEANAAVANITFNGVVSSDSVGYLLLGSFGTYTNVTSRTFIYSDINKLNQSSSVIIHCEASRGITSLTTTSVLVPKVLHCQHAPNALHVVYDTTIVCDLSSAIRSTNDENSLLSSPEVSLYVASSIVSAIEYIHGAGIVYRSIQPESLNVDSHGHVVFMDFRISKIGGIGNRSFTICGASDYLAPEQISQRGHGGPVDLWSMGLLLFELCTGTHPFSANSEVATYAKIASFGSKSFPDLTFPESISPEMKSLINKLLMPTPEARLGAGIGGLVNLKNHSVFNGVDWDNVAAKPSPVTLSAIVNTELSEIIKLGFSSDIAQKFDLVDSNASLDWVLDIHL